MKYLTVPAIGIGTDDDTIRPDLPDSVSFVGKDDPKTNSFLVAVPDGATVAAKTGRTTLATRKAQTDAMAARKLSESDVQTWRVG